MTKDLIKNIHRLHTTSMGEKRITDNLGIADCNAVEWCRLRILDDRAVIERQGKNWYIHIDGSVITVNASSYTIITAHKE